MFLRLRRAERGDTIVEVLIAIAIVSLVLAGAFAATNLSLKSTRQAQEHAEGLRIVESQIELLRANSSDNSIYTGGAFCYDAAGVKNTGTCTFTNGIDYTTTISRSTTGSSHIFTATVVWENINGNGQDNVTLRYKVNK